MIKTEQLGTYTLCWPGGVFPLGGDALALGQFATVRRGWRVCDLGCGSGVLLLLLAERAKELALFGVERHPLSAQTARENLQRNALAGHLVTGDLRDDPFPGQKFDLVVANPPYFPLGSGGDAGPARSEHHCTLAQLCAAAQSMLRTGGRFALCHRPERLADVMCTLRQYKLEPKRLRLVSHAAGHKPSVVLVEGVLQGRAGLEILP